VQFCFKFARSTDLAAWKKLEMASCSPGWRRIQRLSGDSLRGRLLYVIYLHAAVTGHKAGFPFLARSKDLAAWELSPFNPILEAGPGEGVNNSDVDLFEYEGNTYVFYATGRPADLGHRPHGDVPVSDAGVLHQLFPGWRPHGKVSAR